MSSKTFEGTNHVWANAISYMGKQCRNLKDKKVNINIIINEV